MVIQRFCVEKCSLFTIRKSSLSEKCDFIEIEIRKRLFGWYEIPATKFNDGTSLLISFQEIFCSSELLSVAGVSPHMNTLSYVTLSNTITNFSDCREGKLFLYALNVSFRSLSFIQSLERKKCLLILLISDWSIQLCLTFSTIPITNLQNNHCEWIASYKYRFLWILTGNAHTYSHVWNKQHTTHPPITKNTNDTSIFQLRKT